MGSNSGSRLYTLTELAGTMCGLQKALVWLCVLLPAALSGRWDWSESVWHLGSWWRKHFESDYWCLVTDSGELLYQDDIDWFDNWGYDLPWPEQGPKTKTRGCTLKPNLATREDDPGFVPSHGASSSAGPSGPGRVACARHR